jgi:hypothetical protein
MNEITMKSDQARKDWAIVLRHVRNGGSVLVQHYKDDIAYITSPPDPYILTLITAEPGDQVDGTRIQEMGGLEARLRELGAGDWLDQQEIGLVYALPTGAEIPVGRSAWRVALPKGTEHELAAAAAHEPQEPGRTSYVATIGTAPDVVEGDFCDVSVIECEEVSAGYDDEGAEILEQRMTNRVAMPAQDTTVRTDDEDSAVKAEDDAERVLLANGWRVTGEWEPSDNSSYATVELA